MLNTKLTNRAVMVTDSLQHAYTEDRFINVKEFYQKLQATLSVYRGLLSVEFRYSMVHLLTTKSLPLST